jgi:hypothetical protein
MPTEEKPGAAVFELADALLRCAAEAAAKVGEKGAFSQGFDSDPSDVSAPVWGSPLQGGWVCTLWRVLPLGC